MRRRAALIVLLAALGLAAGCGEGEEAQPLPETVEGTVPQETATTEEEAGGEGQGDAAAGKQIFASQGCGGCHTLADAGSSGMVGPVLDEAKPSFDKVVERVTNGKGAMPSFKESLDEQQIRDVAAYVSSVAGK